MSHMRTVPHGRMVREPYHDDIRIVADATGLAMSDLPAVLLTHYADVPLLPSEGRNDHSRNRDRCGG